MKMGTALLIFLVSIITFVAELILLVFVAGAAAFGCAFGAAECTESTATGIGEFFFWLMMITLMIGFGSLGYSVLLKIINKFRTPKDNAVKNSTIAGAITAVPIILILFSFVLSSAVPELAQSPQAVETASVQESEVLTGDSENDEKAATPSKVYKLGETAIGDGLEIKINKVRKTSVINEQGNEFIAARSGPDEIFIIVDLSITNVAKEGQLISPAYQSKLVDPEGYTYGVDSNADFALLKSFGTETLQPKVKRSGELGFKVPRDAKQLKLSITPNQFFSSEILFELE